MDTVELECWNFLKQQIQRKIYFYSTQFGLQPLSNQVIDAIVNYFSAGAPVYNHSFQTMVVRLALGIHLAHYQS